MLVWSHDTFLFYEGNADRRLLLFYLANDVLQNSRRKGGEVFMELFRTPLKQAATMARCCECIYNWPRLISFSLALFHLQWFENTDICREDFQNMERTAHI